MKKIQYLFIILFFLSCYDRKETVPEKSIKEKDCVQSSVVKTAQKSNDIVSKTETIIKSKTTIQDSIFFIKGLSFEVNGIPCYWEYKVKQVGIKKKDALNIIILYQKLKTFHNKILFETANEVDNSNYFNLYHSLDGIAKSKVFNLECKDINDDNYCDFRIVIERAAAGANETSEAYLFNPKNKKFEFSKVFSGTNLIYDKEKNRIYTMWKMGARTYGFGYINLKKNRRDIEFVEDIFQDQDTIIYTKSIDKKIIERKRVVLKREEWQGDEVSSEDFQYLLERNKK